MVTSDSIRILVEYLALTGQIDFALEVFGNDSDRYGEGDIDNAFYIANCAAEAGNLAVFSAFIDMFEYTDDDRDEIAAGAAACNHVEILRRQECSINPARSFGQALEEAVETNSIEAVQFLLDINDGFE